MILAASVILAGIIWLFVISLAADLCQSADSEDGCEASEDKEVLYTGDIIIKEGTT